ncbi:hypothetical protein Y032_0012g1843 [Ancylostoma ceylanicum]|uniref:Endonuclease/exonuclease/phosphatase domain-containing protein n=1 Tax=Ancylostoma ceylanicum TaxID=53326 RepID=A0A016VE92_9BILA|nr:hypothetical protein Y032_0012g1843 [Ancylostoma ceylanicum]
MVPDVLCFDLLCPAPLSSIRFVLAYRPPNTNRGEDDRLIDFLYDVCTVQLKTIVLGDFNVEIDTPRHSNKLPNSCSERFSTAFSSSNLIQHVLQPTRGGSILDLVLSTSGLVKSVEILPPFGTSDHNVVHFEVNYHCSNNLFFPLPDFDRVNYKDLRNSFRNLDWMKIFENYSNTSELYYRFCLVVYSKLAQHVPFRMKKSSVLNYPRHIKNLIHQRDRMFHTSAQSSGMTLYKKKFVVILTIISENPKPIVNGAC